jgi:hypothetical protein
MLEISDFMVIELPHSERILDSVSPCHVAERSMLHPRRKKLVGTSFAGKNLLCARQMLSRHARRIAPNESQITSRWAAVLTRTSRSDPLLRQAFQ